MSSRQRRRAHRNLGADLARATPLVPSSRPSAVLGEIGATPLHQTTGRPHGRILAIDLRNPARSLAGADPGGREPIESFSIAAVCFCRNPPQLLLALAVFSPRPPRARYRPRRHRLRQRSGRNWSGHEASSVQFVPHPESIYRYDTAGGSSPVWRANVPIDRGQLELKQVWYASKDGTKIPCSCCIARAAPGRHESRLPHRLRRIHISLTPRSPQGRSVGRECGVFAQPNLRRRRVWRKWHEAGMHEKKQNVFDDFIAPPSGSWQSLHEPFAPRDFGRQQRRLLMGRHHHARPVSRRHLRYRCSTCCASRSSWWHAGGCRITARGRSRRVKYIYAYSLSDVRPGVKYPAVLFTPARRYRVAPSCRKMAGSCRHRPLGRHPPRYTPARPQPRRQSASR